MQTPAVQILQIDFVLFAEFAALVPGIITGDTLLLYKFLNNSPSVKKLH
ncbi:hypothetical protein B6N60_01118 [Richelia sinica FACHB-800]|uniref:Uncharacterized protein n=1 Tax=Richelia sinica FACHB-800 TaxID=1357546 RepID=A0A975T5H1_9NOST|nr:hypothetical protein [Richelia sinica]MBD2664329.1 hypothetical protein [Richelia sinica FACHB-800]QXE22435.1 hypothetical protein B6N60_01118 [Richelia sinica FACHB-800]